MNSSNVTLHSEFIIVGVPGLQEHYNALFVVFLILFLATFLDNLLIVLLVGLDHQLHSPMYILLWNLSLSDICVTTTIIPKLLNVFLGHGSSISFSGCFAQMYFFISLVAVEEFLVASMAYDRYIVVLKPLHFNTIMSTKFCIKMTIIVWGLGFLAPLLSVVLASTLPYCRSNYILHIVCDYPTVMSLACGDVTSQVNYTLLVAMIAIYTPFLYVLWTYCRIVWAVTKMNAMESLKKAFSMSSSHMTVVFLSYVTAAVVYIELRVESIPPDVRIFIGAVYYFLTPLLNPIIYSLTNEKIKAAVYRFFRLKALPCVKNIVYPS